MLNDSRSDFYVVLPSNACSQTQPGNNASDYIIDWESALRLSGNWEAALIEYSFNQFAQHCEKKMKIEYFYNREVSKIYFITKKDEVVTINDRLNDITDLVCSIKVTLVNGKFKLHFQSKYIPYKISFDSDEKAIELGFTERIVVCNEEVMIAPNNINTNVFRYVINITFNVMEEVQNIITFESYLYHSDPKEFCDYIMKHCNSLFENIRLNQNGFIIITWKQEIVRVKFDKEMAENLGVEQLITYIGGTEYTGIKKPKMSSKYSLVYIYTSITDPILVGQIRVPLLRQIWVESKVGDGEIVHENIDHPMYLPISSSSINNIEIQLRDDAGRLISFPTGSKTILIVHFKKYE